MGLDQFLKATIELPEFISLRAERKNKTNEHLGKLRSRIVRELKFNPCTKKVFGLFELPGSVQINMDCAYWRKANQIHNWFNSLHKKQTGEELDNCEEINVDFAQLEELVNICKKQLNLHSEDAAREELPTEEGFFFGSTDYGDFYWENLENTVKQLEPWLQMPEEMRQYVKFTYHGWW